MKRQRPAAPDGRDSAKTSPTRKVTVTFADNPLRGMPGQSDLTITASSDPPLPIPEGGIPSEVERLADYLKGLSTAQLSAIEAIQHVTDLSYERVVVIVTAGDPRAGT